MARPRPALIAALLVADPTGTAPGAPEPILVLVVTQQACLVANGDGGTQVSADAMTVLGAALALRALLEPCGYGTALTTLERPLAEAHHAGTAIAALRERNIDLRLREMLIDRTATHEAGEQPEVLDALTRAVTDLLERTPDPREGDAR